MPQFPKSQFKSVTPIKAAFLLLHNTLPHASCKIAGQQWVHGINARAHSRRSNAAQCPRLAMIRLIPDLSGVNYSFRYF
jgi:hypothetical protein